ncbi:MAG: type II secretion system F family protein [Deltaproteobacteria bacterium]|nr:type II secretion system F family protein [Deltaproteobacteria bacterium]
MATATAKKLPVWIWEAQTKGGEIKKGEMQAADKASVEARLRQMGLNPSKVKKKPLEIYLKMPGSSGVTRKDLVVFTRQFATMIDAGLPLVQCLDILGSQSPNMHFAKVIKTVKEKVETGATLADSLQDHPKVFDELYSQLVRAGEIGGILDTILNRLAAYIEKNDKLVRQVKGALTYPTIVLVAGIAVTVVLLIWVVPVFEKMFKDFGSALPAPTQFFVDASHFMQDYGVYALIGIACLVVAFKLFTNNPRGRIIWDAIKLKMPLFGDLFRKIAVARFSRTLGTMISSGVPVMDALEVCAKSSGNKIVESGLYKVREGISEGRTMVAPMQEVKIFPAMVVQMMGVGEATGAMDQMLAKIADFYDDEVDQAVAALTSMIEPLLMVFLGGVVGGFLIAMYLPIFGLAGAIK